jgi:hypothetical protein
MELASRVFSREKVMSAILVVLLPLAEVGCGCHADDPCLGWARVGATYSVELATRLDPALVTASGARPFPAWYAYPSCGNAFDLSDGQRVSLTASARREAQEECAECYWLQGRVTSVPMVTLADGSPMNMGIPYFEAAHHATIGTSCSGSWTFGVSLLLGGFADAYSGAGKTNLVAYRFFSPADPGSCAAAGGPSAPTCLDSWFTRVRDQNGQVVAQ